MIFGKQKRIATSVAGTLVFAIVSALLVDFVLQQTNRGPPAVQLIDTLDDVINDGIADNIGNDGGSPKLRLVWVIGLEKNGHHMIQDFFVSLQKTLRRSSAKLKHKSEGSRRVVTAKDVNAWKRLVVLQFHGSFVKMLRSKWCPRLDDLESGFRVGFGLGNFEPDPEIRRAQRQRVEQLNGTSAVVSRAIEKMGVVKLGDAFANYGEEKVMAELKSKHLEQRRDKRSTKQKKKTNRGEYYNAVEKEKKLKTREKKKERGHRKKDTAIADDSSADSRAIAEAIAKYGEEKVMAKLNAKKRTRKVVDEMSGRRPREKVKMKKERVGKRQPVEVEEDDEDEEHEYVDDDVDEEYDDDEEEDDLDDGNPDAAEWDARRLVQDSSETLTASRVRRFKDQRVGEMKQKQNERRSKELTKEEKEKMQKKKSKKKRKSARRDREKELREKKKRGVKVVNNIPKKEKLLKKKRTQHKHDGQATVEHNLHRCFEMFVHGQSARQYALANSNLLGCITTEQMPLERGTLVVLPWPSFPFRRNGCYPDIDEMLEMNAALKHSFESIHLIRLRRKPVEGIVSNCIRKTVDAKILPLSARDKESSKFIRSQQANCNETIDSHRQALDEMENQLAAIDWQTADVRLSMSEVDYNQFTDRSATEYVSELLTEWSELFGFDFEDLMSTYERTVKDKSKLKPARVKFDASRISEGITEEYLQSPDWDYLTKELQRKVLDTFY